MIGQLTTTCPAASRFALLAAAYASRWAHHKSYKPRKEHIDHYNEILSTQTSLHRLWCRNQRRRQWSGETVDDEIWVSPALPLKPSVRPLNVAHDPRACYTGAM
jgi:hypothetical protein